MLKHPFSIYNFSVKSYHANKNGKLTLPALLHLLQECAWDNARLNDFGYEILKEQNTFWVLSKLLVQMDEYPNWKDEIEIKTWPKGTDSFFAVRDFEISCNSKIIGRVTSYWLILDLNTKRPQKLGNFNFKHENFLNENAIEQKLDKVKCDDELYILDNRKVYYSDLDVNKHVNNATYVRWILDSYFRDDSCNIISEIEVNFISELLLNDSFKVYGTTNKKYYVIKNEHDKEVCKIALKTKDPD